MYTFIPKLVNTRTSKIKKLEFERFERFLQGMQLDGSCVITIKNLIIIKARIYCIILIEY